jgi:hypothetical protein
VVVIVDLSSSFAPEKILIRLASRNLLPIAEVPEIQTAIAYIMGKIVFAYFASIPCER